MDTDPAIARFDVLPDYNAGFTFHWRMRGGFNDPSPWRYRVQFALSQDGEWVDFSPELVDVIAWKSPGPIRVNKSQVLFFRLVLDTPKGHYESDARTPYGDLARDEFLIAREIMRREVLHMSKMAGVECSVYSVANYGPRCRHCLDPITGYSRDNHCKFCFGTGKLCNRSRGISADRTDNAPLWLFSFQNRITHHHRDRVRACPGRASHLMCK